ncbi:histone-like nucleoid-structuring protein Lsr2 [Actinomycetospora straminea]|uniref:Lsr2 family protein n=1 Tax=Actinomycetospora straminea TaxID=663607 RepID=A0ABP9ENT1_9PSEU|nr:Lsr2 family protein [Actinomycetospora straminea]MDD7936717.1 Lsr2 family protein [Actinomycetospora straminea]
MAQRTVVSLVDDLDGIEANETVEYALDGVTYEIDLNDKNAKQLREIFAPYISAARRTGGRRSTGGRSRSSSSSSPSSSSSRQGVVGRSKEAMKAIRDWAKTEGWSVSDRGRLPNNVLAAYDAAHK